MVGKTKVRVLIGLILLLPIIWGISCAPAKNKKGVYLGDITLPPGFAISIYANDVENARSLVLGDSGTLFVGTRSAGKVYAVVDRNHDARADEVITISEGLTMRKRSDNACFFSVRCFSENSEHAVGWCRSKTWRGALLDSALRLRRSYET